MKIAVVYGTRPEAIKLAPVVEELRRRNVEPTIISTGQHVSLLRGTPAESTMAPQVSLELPSNNNPTDYALTVFGALRRHWQSSPPDIVMVQGDTASAMAGADAAYLLRIPVAHIEAGIRSGDLCDPWPEEHFRVRIDEIAQQWFCATSENSWNLFHEGRDITWANPKAPHAHAVTGNPGIDALYSHTKPSREMDDAVLVTLHRRESFGEPLAAIVRGIEAGAKRHEKLLFYWPAHPNPAVQAVTEKCRMIILTDPVPPQGFARQLSTSRAVITDSGGVQEEAAALGIPCIVAREKTDRPESVTAGIAKVVGRTEQGILDGLDWALGFSTRPDPSTVFGDGHASPSIVDNLLA